MPLLIETLLIEIITGNFVAPEIQEMYPLHLSDHNRELTYYRRDGVVVRVSAL